MAYLECHYYSFVLGNNVDISVVIPTPEGNEQITDKKMTRYNYEEGIAASNIMSYAMSYTGIPAALSQMLMSITDNKYLMLLIINVFLLVLGMFLDLTPAVLIFTPIFLPIVTSLGMHPVHFGVMLILNLAIGSVTPPVGSVLFVGCNVGKVSIEQVIKYIVPTFCAMVVALMLVVYIPDLTLFIPRLLGLV